jgi:hypothetical protein
MVPVAPWISSSMTNPRSVVIVMTCAWKAMAGIIRMMARVIAVITTVTRIGRRIARMIVMTAAMSWVVVPVTTGGWMDRSRVTAAVVASKASAMATTKSAARTASVTATITSVASATGTRHKRRNVHILST